LSSCVSTEEPIARKKERSFEMARIGRRKRKTGRGTQDTVERRMRKRDRNSHRGGGMFRKR
jgi:hypothetical protein